MVEQGSFELARHELNVNLRDSNLRDQVLDIRMRYVKGEICSRMVDERREAVHAVV